MTGRHDAHNTPTPVEFAARPAAALTCPHCWTDQQADRDRCWRCGAHFIFLSEAGRRAPREAQAQAIPA